MDGLDFPLQLRQVSRVFPRDVSQIASSVMREMFLPLGALRRCPSDHFHALREVSLSLARGQKAGILGAHRSGKSVLAGIASGQLQPTGGTVAWSGRRSLIARPGAGFRPGVSVIENLQFRTMLHGITGDAMHATVERTLELCGIGHDEAEKAIGNLSRFVQKQLGLTLLLELPADILVVDEVTGAGTAEARWELRGRLQDRVDNATSLVVSADPAFVSDLVSEAWVLHRGRLYGPFDVEAAVEAYERLPAEDEGEDTPDEAFDPLHPPRAYGGAAGRRGGAYDGENDDEDDRTGDAEPSDPRRRKPAAAPWSVLAIRVDGDEFRHSRFSLLRRPGSVMQVSVELLSQADQTFAGGMFLLQGGNSGTEVARARWDRETIAVSAGERMMLSFELVAPDWGEAFYGLAFCPQADTGRDFVGHRLKVLIFGVGRQPDVPVEHALDIRNSRFERKLENASVDPLSRCEEGQQAPREMVREVRTAAQDRSTA